MIANKIKMIVNFNIIFIFEMWYLYAPVHLSDELHDVAKYRWLLFGIPKTKTNKHNHCIT